MRSFYQFLVFSINATRKFGGTTTAIIQQGLPTTMTSVAGALFAAA
jgi:hypothetical protein